MRWLLAVALDGDPDPFMLFKPSGEILRGEDGTIVRYPTDMAAMHAGLKLDIAERRASVGEAEAQQQPAEHSGDGDGAEGTAVEAHPHTVADPSTNPGHLTA